jgi:hypothetical protein
LKTFNPNRNLQNYKKPEFKTMKKIIILTTIILYSINVSAQFNTYEYSRKLDKIAKEDFYSIPLLPEVIARTVSGFNDIRIYDAGKDTVEVPYLTERLGDRTEEKPINFELINDVTNLKCCSYVTLKMNDQKVINMISLDIAESNFDKILTLEGSNDNKQWFTIREHLRITGFDNSSLQFRSTSISFPSAEYEYFRIKFDDDGSPRIKVTGAAAFENKVTKGFYDEIAIKNKKQSENKKEKISELTVELEKNFMLSYITLSSNDKNDFYRNINIYRSAGTYHTPKGDIESWQMLNSGVIISGEENTFTLGNDHATKLKIEIINYDNQPITISDLKLFSEKMALITKLPASDNLFLVYGKKGDNAPIYDLVHFKEKIPANLTPVNVGKEEKISEAPLKAATSPLIENKMWLWSVMGIVILLIGYFALSMVRKENKEG